MKLAFLCLILAPLAVTAATQSARGARVLARLGDAAQGAPVQPRSHP